MPEKTVESGDKGRKFAFEFIATTKAAEDYLAEGYKGRKSKVNGLMLFDDVEGHVNSRMCNEFANVEWTWGSQENPFTAGEKASFPVTAIIPEGSPTPEFANFGWCMNMLKGVKPIPTDKPKETLRDAAHDWTKTILPLKDNQLTLITEEYVNAWNAMTLAPVRDGNRYLPKVTGHEPGVEIIVSDSIRRRDWMREAFGLGVDLRLTVNTAKPPEAILASNPDLSTVWSIIKSWLADKGYDVGTVNLAEDTIHNKKGQPMKLTRAIGSSTPETLPPNFLERCQTIGNTKALPTKESFLAIFSAAFSAKDQVTLSANPADFITSAFGGGFTSCHAPGGAHFAGNLNFARAANVLMAFVGVPGNKTGRAWLWIDRKTPQMWLLKTHGVFPEHLRKVAREYIQHKLMPDTKWLRYVGKAFDTATQADGGTQGYFDKQGHDIAHPEGTKMNTTMVAEDLVAVCAICGKERPDQRTGCCTEHEVVLVKPYSCRGCGERLFVEEIALTKDHYHCCAGCIRTCECCGDLTPTPLCVRGDRRATLVYCPKCVAEKTYPCSHCGEHYVGEYHPIQALGGRTYCPQCYNSIAAPCPACKETKLKSHIIAGVRKCLSCYSQTPRCTRCGTRRAKLNEAGLCPHCQGA